jgi:tight adherence protein B
VTAYASALVAGLAVGAVGAAVRVALVATRRLRVRDRLPTPLLATSRRPTLRPPAWFVRAFDDAAVDLEPGVAWTAAVAALAALGAAGAVLGGPALLLLAIVAGATGGGLALFGRRGRSAMVLEQALPGALEAMARALRSGASLHTAVSEAAAGTEGRLGVELDRVDAATRRGVPLLVALDALAVRAPSAGVRLAVAALALGVETGGAQARAIDGVAMTLRDRFAAAAEARALAAQTRASVWVISLAPVVFCVFAVVTDPRTASFFFRSTPGLTFLACGLALDVAGTVWMRRLSRVVP